MLLRRSLRAMTHMIIPDCLLVCLTSHSLVIAVLMVAPLFSARGLLPLQCPKNTSHQVPLEFPMRQVGLQQRQPLCTTGFPVTLNMQANDFMPASASSSSNIDFRNSSDNSGLSHSLRRSRSRSPAPTKFLHGQIQHVECTLPAAHPNQSLCDANSCKDFGTGPVMSCSPHLA